MNIIMTTLRIEGHCAYMLGPIVIPPFFDSFAEEDYVRQSHDLIECYGMIHPKEGEKYETLSQSHPHLLFTITRRGLNDTVAYSWTLQGGIFSDQETFEVVYENDREGG